MLDSGEASLSEEAKTAQHLQDLQPIMAEKGAGQSSLSSEISSLQDDNARVTTLARTFTRESSYPQDVNPFLSPTPTLDPNSSQFDARKWAKTLLHAFAQDPEKYPRPPVGVSWRNLGVHGFGKDTDYQKDILNLLWRAPLIAREWISQRRRKIQILDNFDGLVKSGEMLLVLGRPGSGVSTLLKTIAGHVHGLYLDQESHINYQGIPWDTMHSRFRGEVIYQAETDIHFPQLTVGETLQFAALARTPKNRLPGVSRETYATHLRDVVMAIFGISHTVNTRIGNDFIRGVSGGERKRVSIAEVTLNQSAIQCWDNSTRGLDSATALEFAKTLKLSTELGETAAIVAMYQASQPAYDVFDKVAVLYEGRQIYFGPKDAARQYFIELGYHCPARQTTADFLTSLTNPSERVVQPGFEDRVPRTPDEFALVWKNSQSRAELLRDIEIFEQEFPINGQHFQMLKESRKTQQASFTRSKSPYTISIPMQIRLCMTRGFQRIMGDKAFVVVTILANLVISLVLGSIYYKLPPVAESMNSRCVLLYFAIVFNGLSSALEIFSLYAQRPIVEKQSRYASYHPFAEAVASIICDLPTKILSTICFNIPLYFMAQLRQEAGSFFIFLLFGFTCTFTMSMILRTIAQVSRTVQQALTPAAIFILGLVIYTGFILPTRNMQGWLRWINYIDPISYAYESLAANEFTNRQFPCTQFIPMGPPYANATPLERTCSVAGALPGQDFVSGDTFINANYGFYFSHVWRNFGILIGYIVFFSMTYILAAEYLSLEPSKGEVLVFRRNHISLGSKKRHQDEESGATDTAPSEPREKSESPDSSVGRTTEIQSRNVFHWSDVCYDITIKGQPRRILDHVDGWIKPGTLTALMGATGAGKTTLLDVLADRVTMGVVNGDILVNGIPRGNAFQRQTGYVQQQDIHLETATIREALRFSASLRQPYSIPKAEKDSYVEEVIKLLDMEAYADAIIGVPGEGLNVEQRKRLTIGVELAAKPDLLLFLDEPTSGLDSQTAWSIASLLRKLSDNGQAILCTIHQPSAMLFQQFDRLLLLSFGGKTVYFGDIGKDAETLTTYFERKGASPCGDENPAEWMLRVIGAAPGARADQNWAEVWRNSEEYQSVQKELRALELGPPCSESGHQDDITSTAYYATPFYYQLLMCTKRVFEQYWRSPSYIYAKLILCGGTSLFIGVSFYKSELTLAGLQNQMFAIFMLLVIFAFLVYQTMPQFILQRQQYEGRERSSRAYSWYTFLLSNMIVELPWSTFASLLVFFPFYYLVGMNKNAIPTHSVTERGGLMFLLTWSFLIFESTFADMVIAGVETAEVGAVIGLLLFAMSLIFSGVMVPKNSLPGFWIFMYRVSPLTYIISAMLSTGLANHEVQCDTIELLHFQPPPGQTCGDYMAPFNQVAFGAVYNPEATSACEFCSLSNTNTFLATVDTFYSDRWRNFGLIWVYIAFNTGATLLLYWLARVPKKFSWKALLKSGLRFRRG
ncbi:ABC-2 type transporter-domain-containing protein [Hypoxylon trugodes]|uniref:ABC-2 type transporter-domain-containing protein n=1 Tax=Hypoxylon trugodes TaxID=326681 RepID=UPI002194BBF5|nr:ABC-2 type transporter-domain-containing protein [Hypoxylon trugodes]KAI1390698.1 ABC-2 type transporter-domain-containing protein [Hypoxylon trugodes]